MAQRADPKQRVTFEELLRACLYEQEALRRVLVRKGAGVQRRGPEGDQGAAT